MEKLARMPSERARISVKMMGRWEDGEGEGDGESGPDDGGARPVAHLPSFGSPGLAVLHKASRNHCTLQQVANLLTPASSLGVRGRRPTC